MSQKLIENLKFQRVSNAVAAGSTDSNGSSVDLQGFDGVLFVALLGTLTANQVTALKAQQSSDDGSSDTWADIKDSLVGPMEDDDDNQCLILDVHRPTERYVRPVVERATANAVIDGVIAILYEAKSRPTVQDAATIAFSGSISAEPEGTA